MAGRGANGRSTIVKQDDGRWHGFVSMGAKGDGSRDRRHVSTATRAAVVEKVKSLEAKRDAGMVRPSGKATLVDEWLDYWVENIASVRVRARTLATYRTMIRLHLNPYIGKRRLDQLQPEHLEQTYKQLLDKGLSPASVLRVHRMLHRALKIAMQRDRVARNVATLVEPPRQERPKTPEPLDVEECKRVLAAAEGLRNSARWAVALALGCASPKRWRCSGRTSTSIAACSRYVVVCIAFPARDWCLPSPRLTVRAGPSLCQRRWSKRYASSALRRTRNAWSPAPSGTIGISSSPSRTAGRWTNTRITRRGSSC